MARSDSNLLRVFLLFLCIIIIIVIVTLLVLLFLVVPLLCVIFFCLLCLLMLTECLPLLCKFIGIGRVISNNNVVEDGAALHLPQVKANEAKVRKFVHFVVILILWIVNLLCLPHSFVCWVVDSLDTPVALECCIILHGCLPLAVLLIIPIIRLPM